MVSCSDGQARRYVSQGHLWKSLEQPAIIGTELLGYLVINGKVLNLSNGPRETRRRRDGLVLVWA